jgi:D-arabinose 1-dehydrogenase-like Zn-dependent alcohol dehydrogenase
MILLCRIKRYQVTTVSERLSRKSRQLKGGKLTNFKDPGTFQQYALAPANYVTPIPDALSSADAAPMLCAGVTTVSILLHSPNAAEKGAAWPHMRSRDITEC